MNYAKILINEVHSDAFFTFSQGWFDQFKIRNSIALHHATNIAHRCPTDLVDTTNTFTTVFTELQPAEK